MVLFETLYDLASQKDQVLSTLKIGKTHCPLTPRTPPPILGYPDIDFIIFTEFLSC